MACNSGGYDPGPSDTSEPIISFFAFSLRSGRVYLARMPLPCRVVFATIFQPNDFFYTRRK